MSADQFLYLVPYLISLGISFGILFYSWIHRGDKGAAAYTIYMAGQFLSLLGFLLELVTPHLEIKVLWDKFQWLTLGLTAIPAFLLFAIQYTDHKLRNPRLFWAIILSIPIIFNILVATDGAHHLIYPNPSLKPGQPFSELKYDFTASVYIFALYLYLTPLYGILLMGREAIRKPGIYRRQITTILVGFLIPLLFSIFSLFNIYIAPQRDATPFTFAIGNLIVAWGLFRYGTFEIVPIARERVIENMNDPVIVLDAMNRIVDINTAALMDMGKKLPDVISRSPAEVFTRWPEVVEMLETSHEERKEIVVKTADDTLFYDISISPITNKNRGTIGYIVVARDITRQKTLEVSYRILSEELEKRVKERTEELRESAERYRAVIENQSEFIVRWEPGGARTFVNDAYCRYFAITPEQAISTSFISLVVEEDRQAIEDKISRLSSGAASVETEIHRVINPDGSIGWQEWTDQAIRDESGKVVEIQSIGRDITERKLAEEALRESEATYRKAIEVAGAVPYRQSYTGVGNHIRYEFVGEGIRQITGYEPEEFNEPVWDSLVRETHLLGELAKFSWGEAIHRVRTGASPIWQCEHRIQTRTGETRWVYEAAVELRDQTGNSHGSIGLYQDITKRKETEEALLQESALNAKMASDLQLAYDNTLEGWSHAMDLRDKETEGHTQRVTTMTLKLASRFEFSEDELVQIKRGALLHDIGKMGIPDTILLKADSLTDDEWVIMRKHPVFAFEMLSRIKYLQSALDIPYCHHEKWDGTGYPRGLHGEEIPLTARIFAVVDVWDALSFDRPYRSAWQKEKVLEYLQNESGRHFDPKIVPQFIDLLNRGAL